LDTIHKYAQMILISNDLMFLQRYILRKTVLYAQSGQIRDSGEGVMPRIQRGAKKIESGVLQALHACEQTHAIALTVPDQDLRRTERSQPRPKFESCLGHSGRPAAARADRDPVAPTNCGKTQP
jgi:hypothetical protein